MAIISGWCFKNITKGLIKISYDDEYNRYGEWLHIYIINPDGTINNNKDLTYCQRDHFFLTFDEALQGLINWLDTEAKKALLKHSKLIKAKELALWQQNDPEHRVYKEPKKPRQSKKAKGTPVTTEVIFYQWSQLLREAEGLEYMQLLDQMDAVQIEENTSITDMNEKLGKLLEDVDKTNPLYTKLQLLYSDTRQ